MAGRLEALHGVLALPRRLVGVFGTIVEIAALPVLHPRQHLPLGRAIARELVRDQHPRDVGAALEQLAEEFLGRRFVPAALDQDVEDVAVLIDSAPEIMALPVRSRILILLSNTHALDHARF